MTTVQDVLNYLYELAPGSFAEDWDNIGLMCGRGGREVTKILVALDASLAAADEAKSRGCELAVVHHPLIFRGLKSVSDRGIEGVRAMKFLENGVSVISMHTNLDCAPGGVNDALAGLLGLKNVRVLPDGEYSNLVRWGEIEPRPLPEFLAFVKDTLGCPGLRYADGGKTVRRVAVGGGSCGEFLEKMPEIGCDTFVTADVKYHLFADAAEMGINLIDAGHFETENPVTAVLREKLAERFPETAVLLSESHGDVTRFF